MKKIYVVTCVYNDQQSLDRLLREIGRIEQEGATFYVVAVDDGSFDDPVTKEAAQEYKSLVTLVALRRNLGHQRALAIGLSQVVLRGDADLVVIMDGDGEDRPADIRKLLAELERGGCEIVVAQRRKREESGWFKLFYYMYRAVFRLLTGHQINFGNFSAMTSEAAKRLVYMEDLWMHLPGAIIMSRLPMRSVLIDRGNRYFGDSKMNLVSLITHGLRSVAVFIESVLTRIILFCAIVAGTSLILMLAAMVNKILGFATPGWLTIVVGALLGVLIQTATISLVAILLAINTRNKAGLMPIKIAGNYIDEVASFGLANEGGPTKERAYDARLTPTMVGSSKQSRN